MTTLHHPYTLYAGSGVVSNGVDYFYVGDDAGEVDGEVDGEPMALHLERLRYNALRRLAESDACSECARLAAIRPPRYAVTYASMAGDRPAVGFVDFGAAHRALHNWNAGKPDALGWFHPQPLDRGEWTVAVVLLAKATP